MSRIERARYATGSTLLGIIFGATFTALIIFGYLPIDKANFQVAILQIIVYAIIEAIVIAIIVVFLFGKKPRRQV